MAGAPALTATAPATATTARAVDYVALARPRLNLVVVITAGMGFALAAPAFDLWPFTATVVGTALVAGGASAANQLLERHGDARMRRTRNRPLPDGRLTPRQAAAFSAITAGVGVGLLAVVTTPAASLLAAATFVAYVAIYTPLKRRTPWALVVGAVPGAAPTLVGWAASSALSIDAWILFVILFLWQIPHFLAIAWLYREDYARAAIDAWPVRHPDGRTTAALAVACSVALVVATALPAMTGLISPVYAAMATAASATLLAGAVGFARHRTTRAARRLFAGSLLHLLVVCLLYLVGSIALR